MKSALATALSCWPPPPARPPARRSGRPRQEQGDRCHPAGQPGVVPSLLVPRQRRSAGRILRQSLHAGARRAPRVAQAPGLKAVWVVVTPADRIARLVKGAIDLECGSTTVRARDASRGQRLPRGSEPDALPSLPLRARPDLRAETYGRWFVPFAMASPLTTALYFLHSWAD